MVDLNPRMPAPNEVVLVKFQIPVVSREPEIVAFFYNELGDINGYVSVDDEMFQAMGGLTKVFAWVSYVELTDAVEIERWLLDEEDWPSW